MNEWRYITTIRVTHDAWSRWGGYPIPCKRGNRNCPAGIVRGGMTGEYFPGNVRIPSVLITSTFQSVTGPLAQLSGAWPCCPLSKEVAASCTFHWHDINASLHVCLSARPVLSSWLSLMSLMALWTSHCVSDNAFVHSSTDTYAQHRHDYVTHSREMARPQTGYGDIERTDNCYVMLCYVRNRNRNRKKKQFCNAHKVNE